MSYQLFVSPRCKFCKQLLDKVNNDKIQNVQVTNIDREGVPRNVTSVPTMIAGDSIFVGKQCFEFVDSLKSNNMEGFAFTNEQNGVFSFISNNEASCESTQNFAFISDSQSDSAQTPRQDTKTPEENDFMDQLINKRNSEIPQPVKRI